MKRLMNWAVIVVLAIAVAGCGKGDGLLRTQGRLLKGGEKFKPADGELIQITFVPILPDGRAPLDHYYADVDQAAATFMPAGKNKRGMPPGKYRVAVALMKKKKDVLGGRFDDERSPFIVDVGADTKEIVIDLDKSSAG